MSRAKKFAALQRTVLPAILTWSFVAAASDFPAATVGDSSTATAPAMGKSDKEVERDIVVALAHDDINNSSVYRNVKIVSTRGRVTLKGRVKNEKQKTKLIHITSEIVGPTNIQDEVTVK